MCVCVCLCLPVYVYVVFKEQMCHVKCYFASDTCSVLCVTRNKTGTTAYHQIRTRHRVPDESFDDDEVLCEGQYINVSMMEKGREDS